MRQIDRQASFATLWTTLATATPAGGRPAVASGSRRRGRDRGAGVVLRHALDTLRLWRERARGRQQLRTFDDHLLRDIGITRLQAAAEADKPFWRA
jgi:uncharacterized protein YjiS (DUF1127 family)